MKNSSSINPLDIIEIKENSPVTTSLKIAEIFGKRHDNIIRIIKSLDCSDDFLLLNFEVCFKNNRLQGCLGYEQKDKEVGCSVGFKLLTFELFFKNKELQSNCNYK